MIVGERIALRAWSRSDLETFLGWFNDPEITIYAGDAYPALSLEQEERRYEKYMEDRHLYCIVTRDDGLLIGECSLFDIDTKNRAAEVGITIGEKEHWDRGYGREALGLLLEIGFEGLGLNRIHLRHVAFNERGHRCFLAVGFTEEGRLRQGAFIKGMFHDVVLMSILAGEYHARATQTGRVTTSWSAA